MSAARFAASGSLLLGAIGFTVDASAAVAQSGSASGVWNDSRSRALVELATRRRAEQLADTGLVDYRANARGYVTFLVSMGSGFLETPKVVKTDQLALEVYWHAPNLSKQRIVGRRDTLLLPTDIQYHRDHLGIVQNNFPDFIRIGEGDEVRDVPHPLSTLGLSLYDYRLSEDSVRIRLPDRVIDLLEVKVRPKDDREPRVIGAIYIDPTAGQVVRMAFNFTRAAFLDKDLEDLAVVLENRLVGGQYWLPSRQEIEIRRTGTWLDYPVRGIIRGRWEIEDYRFNLAMPAPTFSGPEIVLAPAEELKRFPWQGTIMDSLPADVRATVDPDIKRVLDEARILVRAQALQRMQAVRVSAPHASDFLSVSRVEGLAVGGGFTTRLPANVSFHGRARYGTDDRAGKGLARIQLEQPSGDRVEAFASRDFVDIGDQPERSSITNSLAAQEFGSDVTDPYRLDALGIRGLFRLSGGDLALSVSNEWHRALAVRASPVSGAYEPTAIIARVNGRRFAFSAYRPLEDWIGPGELQVTANASLLRFDRGPAPTFGSVIGSAVVSALRGSLTVEHQSLRDQMKLVLREQTAGVLGDAPLPPQELVYFGGPVSAPGYALHSISGTVGSTTRIELQFPVSFFPIPLGRFGRVPGEAHLAPYLTTAIVRGAVTCTGTVIGRCPTLANGVYPSVGVGLLTVFDVLRFDIARGLKNGRWMFNVDVTRDFWSIL